MRGRPARIVVWALAHRRAVLAAWGVLLLAALPGIPRLEQENSAEVFFLAGTPEEARYRAFTATFGGDEVTRLVLSGPGLWSAEGLGWLGEVEAAAAALPGVDAASGLAGRFAGAGWPPSEPAALRAAARADPLARALGWIDARGEVATLLVSTHPLPRGESEALAAALDALLAEPPPGVTATGLGPRTLDAAFDAYGAEIAGRFLPLLALVSLLLLALSFRDAAGTLLPFSLVAAALVPLLGAMGYLGVRFNLVLAILPPLLFVIALAAAVHLLVRCREREATGEEGAAATLATYAEKGRAVVWTAATTALGFAALAGSPVGPVRSLGLWAAAGCGLLAAASFTLFPVLLAATHARRALPERRVERWAGRLGRRLAAGAAARRGAVLTLFALAALAAAAGLPRLRSESNALAYLPEDHPVRREVAAL
ncbi:MAG TPA: MMPL family transporter, partial [Thermoanaerobaculia bacterium]|nr:MMPL family transporter [Thermoanaerobaculia bacterium]